MRVTGLYVICERCATTRYLRCSVNQDIYQLLPALLVKHGVIARQEGIRLYYGMGYLLALVHCTSPPHRLPL